MKLAIALASLAAAASLAHAEPRQYLATSAMLGDAAPDAGLSLVAAVEGGYRMSPAWWAHGLVAGGRSGDDQGAGHLMEVRAGMEARSCSLAGAICAVAGADLGALHNTWTGDASAEDVSSIVLVPHIGLDGGGRNLRARLGVETDLALSGTHTTTDMDDASTLGLVGVFLSAGVAAQW